MQMRMMMMTRMKMMMRNVCQKQADGSSDTWMGVSSERVPLS